MRETGREVMDNVQPMQTVIFYCVGGSGLHDVTLKCQKGEKKGRDKDYLVVYSLLSF